jgi:hypothetical protein
MATATATSIADVEVGEKTPLVNGGDEVLEDLPESTKKEKAVAGLAAVSFTASLASIIFTANPIVYVSGILGAILSPYAAIQQRKITDVDALSETNERRTCNCYCCFDCDCGSLEDKMEQAHTSHTLFYISEFFFSIIQ